MQDLSIYLFLIALTGLARAAPQAAPTSTGQTTFEATFPADSTPEYVGQQIAALQACDQGATFDVKDGTDTRVGSDSPDFHAKCIIATISSNCYNSQIPGFTPHTIYPGTTAEPAQYCTENAVAVS